MKNANFSEKINADPGTLSFSQLRSQFEEQRFDSFPPYASAGWPGEQLFQCAPGVAFQLHRMVLKNGTMSTAGRFAIVRTPVDPLAILVSTHNRWEGLSLEHQIRSRYPPTIWAAAVPSLALSYRSYPLRVKWHSGCHRREKIRRPRPGIGAELRVDSSVAILRHGGFSAGGYFDQG